MNDYQGDVWDECNPLIRSGEIAQYTTEHGVCIGPTRFWTRSTLDAPWVEVAKDEYRKVASSDHPWTKRPPTYAELIDEGTPPVAIVDIALQHKGNIGTAIEIVHKNPISAEKGDVLQTLNLSEVWEIPADWVLRQVKAPARIPSRYCVFG